MKEVCRYLGCDQGDEHTVLITVRKSVFNLSVLIGLEPVKRVEMFKGKVGDGEEPFRCITTGFKASPSKQRTIIEFLKKRL